jgi:hypothetical protein
MADTHTDAEPEHAPELEATDARQGRWGRHMLWVLLAGLLLVVIALFGTWLSRAGDLEAVDNRARATAEEGPNATATLVEPKNRETDVRPVGAQPQ